MVSDGTGVLLLQKLYFIHKRRAGIRQISRNKPEKNNRDGLVGRILPVMRMVLVKLFRIVYKDEPDNDAESTPAGPLIVNFGT